jgi:hypothetical protein
MFAARHELLLKGDPSSESLSSSMPARESVDDRVAGLDCRADGHLTKPFWFRALLTPTRRPDDGVVGHDELRTQPTTTIEVRDGD